jgi:serine/threonine protein kinase
MSVDTAAALVDAIRRYRLLEPPQLKELTERLGTVAPAADDLATELLERGWLTPFQVKRLTQGRGQELVLEPYILLERLDQPAIGPLFRARHRHMKRVVALQVVRAEWLARPGAVERFLHDIHAASQLTHPNVVHVHDVGQIGRLHYFIHEDLEGLDLDRMICQFGPLPVGPACVFIRQAALGLQHAFERGLLHHDLKPSALFVTRKGRHGGSPRPEDFEETLIGADGSGAVMVKVRRLGLTSLLPPEVGASRDREGQEAAGSADCLAPEQKPGEAPTDVRSSLYSLGCVFYYLLTGRVPFPGGSAREKHERHRVDEPIPLERLRPEVPPQAAEVVHRLMAKRPEDRYPNPAAVTDALATVIGVSPDAEISDWEGAPAGSTAALTADPPPQMESEVAPSLHSAPIPEAGASSVILAGEPGGFDLSSDRSVEDVSTRYRRRAESERKRLMLFVVGGSVGLASLVAATAIVALLQLGESAPRPPDREMAAEEPLPPKTWKYVKKATREETILATLLANRQPALQGIWHYIGPFDNPPEFKGFEAVYPPETEIELAKTYPGKGGQMAAWKELTGFATGRVVDLKRFPDPDWSCVYLYHEEEADEEVTLPVFFGSDDTLTIWCNGEKVWANFVTRAAGPNQDYVRLKLRKGSNRLLFKICNGTGDWAFYAQPLFTPPLDEALGSRLLRDF